MAKMQAIDISEIKTATRLIQSEVLESAALLNAQFLQDAKINVITDLENVASAFVFDRKTGTTRRYQAGQKLNTGIGKMWENELKVTLSWGRHVDNIQNYREKEPFHMNGSSFVAPNTEFAIRQMGIIHSEDVLNCFFHGDESKGVEDPLGLYNGVCAHVAAHKTAGRISEAKRNLIKTDPFTTTSSMADNYQNFVEWYNAWHPMLKSAPEVLVYCTQETRLRIIQGYLAQYQGLQNVNVYDANFRFVDTPNVVLVPLVAMGTGSMLIATVPYNISYGVDMADPTTTFINVDRDPEDANNIIYQIQTAQGIRIDNMKASHFCVNDQTLTPFDTNEVEDDEEEGTTTPPQEGVGG